MSGIGGGTGTGTFEYNGIKDFLPFAKRYGIMYALQEDELQFGIRVLDGIEKLSSAFEQIFSQKTHAILDNNQGDSTKLKRPSSRPYGCYW